MAITYKPDEILRKRMPTKQVEKLVTGKLTLNKTALRTLSNMGVLKKATLQDVALKVIKSYKKAFSQEIKDGASRAMALAEAINDKKQMVNRVQSTAIFEISQEIRSQYLGEFYIWLPSDADEPDPIHQLNYGQKFKIGEGEQPGDRYGCRCGMQILTDDEELDL